MQGNRVNPSGDSGPKVYFIDYNYDHMPQQYSRAMASSPCGSVDPNPGGTDRLEDSKPVPPNVEINKARFSGSILSKNVLSGLGPAGSKHKIDHRTNLDKAKRARQTGEHKKTVQR